MAVDVPTAVRLVNTVLHAPSVTVVWIDPSHFEAALAILGRHDDKGWSFTDCTSFAVMHDLGVQKGFSFDRNFADAGFTRLP